MATIGGSNTITSNLILHLDAANPKSYVSGSTTWYDMSDDQKNMTLSNASFSTGNAGKVIFNGSAGSNGGVNLSDKCYGPYISIEAWAKQTSPLTTDSWLFDMDFTGYRIWGNIDTGLMVRGPSAGWSAMTWVPNIGEWYHFVGTIYDSTEANNGKQYVNGALHSQTTLGLKSFGPVGNPTNFARVASHWGGGAPRPFEVGMIKVYNKVLTASEILQNYNAQKSRYNL
jgi:hypothetical protein